MKDLENKIKQKFGTRNFELNDKLINKNYE